MAFQLNDRSKSNIIAAALFADGAAACLIAGDEVGPPPNPRLLKAEEYSTPSIVAARNVARISNTAFIG